MTKRYYYNVTGSGYIDITGKTDEEIADKFADMSAEKLLEGADVQIEYIGDNDIEDVAM